MKLRQDTRRAILVGAVITLLSVTVSFVPVWLWLQIDPVVRVADIYISCIVLPALIAPTCSTFILRAQLKAERLAADNHHLANHDDLTDLPNRRAFFAWSGEILSHARPSTDVFACAIADIDNFKAINDTHGHETGDQILKGVASALRDLVPETVTAARLGGEEFAIAGLFSSEMAARIWFEALVREIALRRQTRGLHVTVSLGWCIRDRGEMLSSMLSRADKALYRAKHSGKDRAVGPAPAGRDEGRKTSAA